jgi:hypothetical protein
VLTGHRALTTSHYFSGCVYWSLTSLPDPKTGLCHLKALSGFVPPFRRDGAFI